MNSIIQILLYEISEYKHWYYDDKCCICCRDICINFFA